MREMINEILEAAFASYIERGGTGRIDIGEITSKYNQNPHEVGRYLVDEGLVKHQQFHPTTFVATISIYGIEKIHSEYFGQHVSTIISSLGLAGNGWASIMETLNWEIQDFQRAFDLAKLLESNNLIEAQFRHNDVAIKLTLKGQMLYDDNKASFI